jgi:hypothetical protein
LIAEVLIRTTGSTKTIAGLHVLPTSRSFEEINEFTLAEKGTSQYAGLLIAMAAAGFTLYVFVLCIRTRMGKEKWLWLILILIGLFRLTVNWTTGAWTFSPLTIQAPVVMAGCSPYGACTIQIVVPVGAIAFMLLRKRRPAEDRLLPTEPSTIGQ